MSRNNRQEERLPIIVLWDAILKHKKLAVAVVAAVIVAVGGYYGYQHYEEKKEVETAMKQAFDHLTEIIGTYKNSSVTLVLNADNTAVLITDNYGYGGTRHLGHWDEKTPGYPIRIDFADSFEASICGKSDGYFGDLYFFASALWPSLDAIQSRDYSSAEALKKE